MLKSLTCLINVNFIRSFASFRSIRLKFSVSLKNKVFKNRILNQKYLIWSTLIWVIYYFEILWNTHVKVRNRYILNYFGPTRIIKFLVNAKSTIRTHRTEKSKNLFWYISRKILEISLNFFRLIFLQVWSKNVSFYTKFKTFRKWEILKKNYIMRPSYWLEAIMRYKKTERDMYKCTFLSAGTKTII